MRDAGHLMDSINTSTAVHRLGKVVRRLRDKDAGAWLHSPGNAWLVAACFQPATPTTMSYVTATHASHRSCAQHQLVHHRLPLTWHAAWLPAGLPKRVVQDEQYRRLVARVQKLAEGQGEGGTARYRPRGLANTLWGLAGAHS